MDKCWLHPDRLIIEDIRLSVKCALHATATVILLYIHTHRTLPLYLFFINSLLTRSMYEIKWLITRLILNHISLSLILTTYCGCTFSFHSLLTIDGWDHYICILTVFYMKYTYNTFFIPVNLFGLQCTLRSTKSGSVHCSFGCYPLEDANNQKPCIVN